MLVKAYRTRDLSSYSLGNILLANVGNAVHSVYVFSLPPGPLWVLHSFYAGEHGPDADVVPQVPRRRQAARTGGPALGSR